MRLAYSTNAYTRFDLSDAINSIRKLGFNGIEILADIPHLTPTSDVNKVRKLLNAFKISNVNANTSRYLKKSGDGFWPRLTDIKKRNLRIDYIKWAIKAAHDIGADCVSISTGPPTRKDNGIIYDSLEKILRYADEFSIKIGIEYEPDHLIGGIEDIMQVLKVMNHPLLGANLDLGHAVCNGENIRKVTKLLSGRIWNIHLEDIRSRVHKHLVPGEGDINFLSIKNSLGAIGYNRFVTLELYPYKREPEKAGLLALNYLRSIKF